MQQNLTLSGRIQNYMMKNINNNVFFIFIYSFDSHIFFDVDRFSCSPAVLSTGVVEFGPEVTGKDQTTKMLLNDQDQVKQKII